MNTIQVIQAMILIDKHVLEIGKHMFIVQIILIPFRIGEIKN